MDFSDTVQEAAFRDECRSWLKANVPTAQELEGLSDLQTARLWQKRKFDAGWACVQWPREYGGRDATPIQQVILVEEEARFNVAPSPFAIGHGMAGPTLMAWATEEQKRRFLPTIASGEEVWCQLFSEPAGGSDLAALRTRAVQEGDDWLINGQKIWTSGAQHSNYGILVVRTDPTVPKHKGLTYFFVGMSSPGIEVKPIKQLSGESGFNEVYLTDLRIPDEQRLGEVGQGWQVSLTTLMNERASIGTRAVQIGFDALFKLAQGVTIDDRPAIEDKAVRAKLANWFAQESGLKFTGYRSLTALSRGTTPGPENSIGKLVNAPKVQDMASFALDLLEAGGVILDPDLAPAQALFQNVFMRAPGGRIAGGTDEIMANIIAERVLGLPQDVRTDKSIPFNEIPTAD
jgi:acyl-CoA dehydrogenase